MNQTPVLLCHEQPSTPPAENSTKSKRLKMSSCLFFVVFRCRRLLCCFTVRLFVKPFSVGASRVPHEKHHDRKAGRCIDGRRAAPSPHLCCVIHPKPIRLCVVVRCVTGSLQRASVRKWDLFSEKQGNKTHIHYGLFFTSF